MCFAVFYVLKIILGDKSKEPRQKSATQTIQFKHFLVQISVDINNVGEPKD